MNEETGYRAVLVTLLAAILIVQILILVRILPGAVTWGDFAGPAAKGKSLAERRALLYRLPAVQVYAVHETVDVNVENTPLDVNVENTPEVQIVR